ncbi:SAYSvFN domain-containing protein 1 isoform X2 [Drosophila subobscura]|uniref:SAYSvFN domain-containing protein 1 isoform X2 n=1 Tax=Drosophila subobscura TaxID=7241 RepID=UPI00155A7CA9|nr:SAYSvFN domain-containing protein 1 isoform X2 [Drosophila subobscura]
MADFQEQLKEYRLKKRRKETLESIKDKFHRFWMFGTGSTSNDTKIDLQQPSSNKPELFEENSHDESLSSSANELVEERDTVPETQNHTEGNVLKYTLWTVYLLFWITLYVIAIELKFGLVYLMFSALFGIYFNTRTGPKKQNEISAYSVFNKNFESIDGTLKAEQFEREIRYGSGSVK